MNKKKWEKLQVNKETFHGLIQVFINEYSLFFVNKQTDRQKGGHRSLGQNLSVDRLIFLLNKRWAGHGIQMWTPPVSTTHQPIDLCHGTAALLMFDQTHK